MESLEYNLNDNPIVFDDKRNKIYLLISIVSWLTLLVSSWLSLGLPYSMKFFKIIWVTISINYEKKDSGPYSYFPIMILYEFHYAVFILACSLATIGFIIYMLFRENGNIMELMLGQFSRFHFIPLFCISALFIIGESIDIFKETYDEIEDNDGNYYYVSLYSIFFSLFKEIKIIFNFAFTIIALVSLIYISIKTKVKSPWYAFLSINKGTYSCFISLLVYNFFFSILLYVNIRLLKKGKKKSLTDWIKAGGIAFSLVVGIINSLLSFILKDIMISFTNIVIYTGMLIYFFKIKREERKEFNEFADGIIDIVILAGNVGIIIFLSFNWRRIYKEKE